jgi:hypothetical protein
LWLTFFGAHSRNNYEDRDREKWQERAEVIEINMYKCNITTGSNYACAINRAALHTSRQLPAHNELLCAAIENALKNHKSEWNINCTIIYLHYNRFITIARADTNLNFVGNAHSREGSGNLLTR